ncbi:MAG: integration host factor subunit alpha [Deltaproteobacteria bacterium]|nr:integration host factor subunit alpha [Deltaproteobacteria bacterium]
MSLTKDHIIDNICANCGVSRKISSEHFESVLELIKKSLVSGEDVLITGFGKFCVKDKGARRGRNPATGDDLILDARRVVTFQCSSVLRYKMNGKDRA